MADKPAAEVAAKKVVYAGDLVSVRSYGVDQFDNTAHVEPSALEAYVVDPGGQRIPQDPVDVSSRKAGGKEAAKQEVSNIYEVCHETEKAGRYELHVTLFGEPVLNSPVTFDVEPAAAVPQQSFLVLPPNADSLLADVDKPAIVMLNTCDKYGNPCKTGGL